jgi:hypothetical protein
MKYYEGFDIIAEHHFEAAGYTDERKCLFWLGVIMRVYDFAKGDSRNRPALDKFHSNPNRKSGFSVLMLFQRFAAEMPEELAKKFISTYSEKVEEMAPYEKEFDINGGYTFYGAFVTAAKGFTAVKWMTAAEAEKRWGLSTGTIRAACTRGPLEKYVENGLVRKSGGTWLVSDAAMREAYGEEKKDTV